MFNLKLHRHLTGFRSILRRYERISKFTKAAVERLSDTNPREIGLNDSINRYKRPATIFTLDPKKFAEKNQQRLHIGYLGAIRPPVSLTLHNQSTTVLIPPLQYSHLYIGSKARSTYKRDPFPSDTNGFLHYFMEPGKPRIAGELRFRVTSSDDPASFESGSDLLRQNGQPWSRPLCILPKFYPPLYAKLREEGFIPDDLDRILLTLPLIYPRYNSIRQRLYALNDTFLVDFSSVGSFLFITEQGVETLPLFKIFLDNRRKRLVAPFTGSALARFERSTLPEHNGTRTVVVRFLKIITPVECVIPDYDGRICCPKEGELHQRFGHKKTPKVWCVNIDKAESPVGPLPKGFRIRRGLRLIWDA